MDLFLNTNACNRKKALNEEKNRLSIFQVCNILYMYMIYTYISDTTKLLCIETHF